MVYLSGFNLKTWFVWKKRKDNPALIHQRWPIWIKTRLAMQHKSRTDRHPSLQLSGDLPVETAPAIVMACCDEVYFHRFARNFVQSIIDTSPGLGVHIHIYHPSQETLIAASVMQSDFGPAFTVSYEPAGRSPYAGGHPYFFAAGRFAVAHQLMLTLDVPLLILDIDGIARRDLGAGIAALAGYDVGLIQRPWRKFSWRKILASAVLINPTPAGRLFAARLAAAIERVLKSAPRYHVDQIVIYYLCEFYRRQGVQPKIADLGMAWGDHEFGDDSLIWGAKGPSRKLELEDLARNASDVVAPAIAPTAAPDIKP